MKKIIITIFILVLLATTISFSSISAQPAQLPHQNPATAEGSSDAASLLNLYSDIFNLVSLRQYEDAQTMLEELKHATIPDELKYLADRFNSLAQQLSAAMNDLEFTLDKASALFSENRITEARQLLDSAESAINDTLLLMEDTEAAVVAIGNSLGVFTAIVSSEITLAYERLEAILQHLRETIDELNQLRKSISDNPQVKIDTSFYLPTQLDVTAPAAAQPGLPFNISGQVSFADGTGSRLIQVLLDNIQIAEETVEGQFSIRVTTPEQVTTGEHSLTVAVTPQGRYSGVSRNQIIVISQLAVQTDIQLPRVSFFSNPVQIRGRVYHNLSPLQGARVNIAFRDTSTIVTTSGDGSFTTIMKVPFDLSLIGPQQITIEVEPAEAWYMPFEASKWFLNINAMNTSLVLVIFVSLGALVFSRVRTRPARVFQEAVAAKEEVRQPAIAIQPPALSYELTGTRGRILSAYFDALQVIEKATGISMEPYTTLREFLEITTSQLPATVSNFTQLTLMAEIALYSSYDLPPTEADKTEQISATIKKELDSGAA